VTEQAAPTRGWGRAIKQLRRARGMSQRELSRRAEVGQSQLSRLEEGAQDDTYLSTAGRLAAALGVSLDELVSQRPPDDRLVHARRLALLVLGVDGDVGQQPGELPLERLVTDRSDSNNLKAVRRRIGAMATAVA
jgi:transcriptional regulator with XRE-family HTH domain